jgi:hypothetical protein
MSELTHLDTTEKASADVSDGRDSAAVKSQPSESPSSESAQTPSEATATEPGQPGPKSQAGAVPTVVAGDRAFFGQKPCFTPEIERAAQQIAYWQTLDRPGALITGLNRVGKTFAARYLAESIQIVLGSSAMAFLWPLWSADKSDVEFLKRRISDIGGRDYNNNQRGELSQRLITHLKGRAKAANASRILLIIDEGQIITETQFSIVCDVQEALAHDRPVFSAFFGQPELETLADSFKEKGIKNLVSRYMKLSHRMPGISVNDFAAVLEHLDKVDGRSVVEHHFPDLYATGWRLPHAAPALKGAVEALRTSARIGKPVRLPMEDLRGAINAMLYLMAGCNGSDPRKYVKKSVLVACLKKVSFDKFMHLYAEE